MSTLPRGGSLAAALAVASLLLTACSNGEDEPPPTPPSTPTAESLTFGVFGPEAEIAAFEDLAETYTAAHGTQVEVVSWADRDEAAAEYRAGSELPDVFMVSQRDLGTLVDEGRTQPVDELLDARGVSFGDDYSRDALQAFAVDNSLACMPYSISPMVIYYNTQMIDFDRMERRGLDVPPLDEDGQREDEWSFEQFIAAADFAARPARGTRGVYIEPTLGGFSPFVYSGGGEVFDDPKQPTSLAFSSDETRSALETFLPVFRDPQLTPSAEQLAGSGALERFTEGDLGMIAGFRNLVPVLRAAPDLQFDVMPMPRISRSLTTGEVIGMCISADTDDTGAAADFLVEVLSEEAVAAVVEQGYLVPANVAVATSEAFLQSDQLPANAEVFNASVRDIQLPPQLESWVALEASVADGLLSLVTVPVLDEETLDGLTTQIDLDSQAVLAPPPDPSDSASPSE